jgi:hypothetical protein
MVWVTVVAAPVDPPDPESDVGALAWVEGREASTSSGELARLSMLVFPKEPMSTPNASIASTPAAAALGVGIVIAGAHGAFSAAGSGSGAGACGPAAGEPCSNIAPSRSATGAGNGPRRAPHSTQ